MQYFVNTDVFSVPLSAVSTHPTWCCGGVVNLCLVKCFTMHIFSLTRVKLTAIMKSLCKGHVSVWMLLFISLLSPSSVCLVVNKRAFCVGIGRCDLYLSVIEQCKQQQWCIVMLGGLWCGCTTFHWWSHVFKAQSLWVWSAVVITALHFLKRDHLCFWCRLRMCVYSLKWLNSLS